MFGTLIVLSMLASPGIQIEPPAMILPPLMPPGMTEGRTVTYFGDYATICSVPIGSNPGNPYLLCNVYVWNGERWVFLYSFTLWLPSKEIREIGGGSGTYPVRWYT